MFYFFVKAKKPHLTKNSLNNISLRNFPLFPQTYPPVLFQECIQIELSRIIQILIFSFNVINNLLLVFLKWDPMKPGQPQAQYVVEAGLKLLIFLLLCLKYWDYRYTPPCPASNNLQINKGSFSLTAFSFSLCRLKKLACLNYMYFVSI